jgi:hypothetical protein
MLSVVYAECHQQTHYAQCLYAKCQYAECRGTLILQYKVIWEGIILLKLFRVYKYKNLYIFKKRKGLQNKFSTTNKTNTFSDKVILLQIASDSKIAIQNRACEWTLKKIKELSGVVTFFGRDISQ